MTTPPGPPSRSISVVVPVYHGARTLPALVERLLAVLAPECAFLEIVLVDDDSRDESFEVIRKLADEHGAVRGISLSRNYGQHNATLAGIRSARGEWIVTLDDDLQQPPEELPKLLARLDQGGVDVVYGKPAVKRHGFLRDTASRLTKLAMQSAMGAETARMVSPFRIFRTGLREAFAGYQTTYVNVDVLLTWATTRFAAVTVVNEDRREGASGYDLRRLFRHAMNMVTGFSVVPLQVASLLGFAFTLFGVAVLVFVVTRYLIEGTPVPGFPFLASIVAVFSGAQLFAIGIIGEYLARMHFRLMGRPAYAVRQQAGGSDDDHAAKAERP